jgi:hypothetical protein
MQKDETISLLLKLVQNQINKNENESEEDYNFKVNRIHRLCLKILATNSTPSKLCEKDELFVSQIIRKRCKPLFFHF